MPTNKNAQLRYRILDECFKSKHKKYKITDLLNTVNERLYDVCGKKISLRQLREDIKFMRDRVTFNAPIEAIELEGKECYYTYSDDDFSIYETDLTPTEMEKLHSTIEMLGRYRGITSNIWLEETISSLEYRLGMKPNSEHLVAFEQNERLKGLEHLSELISATIEHKTLRVEYQPYGSAQERRIVYPYFMKQYNNRWFLFALDDKSRRIVNLALDRIIKFKPCSKLFIENTTIDFNHYFDDIVGVSRSYDDEPIEEVVLQFSAQRFPYVLSKPIHKSQEVMPNIENAIVIRVRPTRELMQQILAYGADVTVLSPQWYRQQVKNNLEYCLANYKADNV